MYPYVKPTPNGYRMACPRGHVDLIVRRLQNVPSIAPQIFGPYCHNSKGNMQPVCSCSKRSLAEFAERDCQGDYEIGKEMLHDMCEYFGI